MWRFLNARSGTLNYYVTDEVTFHVYTLPDDYESDLPIPRYSQDAFVNENGNLLINFHRQPCCRTCFSIGDLGVQVSVRSSIRQHLP